MKKPQFEVLASSIYLLLFVIYYVYLPSDGFQCSARCIQCIYIYIWMAQKQLIFLFSIPYLNLCYL